MDPLTNAQVCALAAFERTHGAAHHVPLGPRRERIKGMASSLAVVVQTGPSYMDPIVATIDANGETLAYNEAERR